MGHFFFQINKDIAHRMTCIPRIYNDFVCDTLVLMINVEKKTHLGHLITTYFKMRGQKFKRTVGELDVLI